MRPPKIRRQSWHPGEGANATAVVRDRRRTNDSDDLAEALRRNALRAADHSNGVAIQELLMGKIWSLSALSGKSGGRGVGIRRAEADLQWDAKKSIAEEVDLTAGIRRVADLDLIPIRAVVRQRRVVEVGIEGSAGRGRAEPASQVVIVDGEAGQPARSSARGHTRRGRTWSLHPIDRRGGVKSADGCTKILEEPLSRENSSCC